MSIKVNGNEVIANDRKGSFQGVNPGVYTTATRPSTPSAGDLIFDTDEGSLFLYDGTDWQKAGSSAGEVQVTYALSGENLKDAVVVPTPDYRMEYEFLGLQNMESISAVKIGGVGAGGRSESGGSGGAAANWDYDLPTIPSVENMKKLIVDYGIDVNRNDSPSPTTSLKLADGTVIFSMPNGQNANGTNWGSGSDFITGTATGTSGHGSQGVTDRFAPSISNAEDITGRFVTGGGGGNGSFGDNCSCSGGSWGGINGSTPSGDLPLDSIYREYDFWNIGLARYNFGSDAVNSVVDIANPSCRCAGEVGGIGGQGMSFRPLFIKNLSNDTLMYDRRAFGGGIGGNGGGYQFNRWPIILISITGVHPYPPLITNAINDWTNSYAASFPDW